MHLGPSTPACRSTARARSPASDLASTTSLARLRWSQQGTESQQELLSKLIVFCVLDTGSSGSGFIFSRSV